MKRVRLFSTCAFFFIFSTLLLPGCKKESSVYQFKNELTFTFNGQAQKMTSGWQTESLFDVTSFRFLHTGGIVINRPDLFGGAIFIDYDVQTDNVRCAWLQPENYPTVSALDCNNLNVGGMPIDSVKVFWLHSENYNESLSHCRPTDVGNFKQCQLQADFSITLVNKNNQQITLTNGKALARVELP